MKKECAEQGYCRSKALLLPDNMRKLVFIIVALLSSLQLMAGDNERLFSLYPVPLRSSRLYFKVNISGSGISIVEVRNLIGKTIQVKPLPPGADEIWFDEMDSNPNGVYVVVAKNAQNRILEISKFILNK